MGEGVKQVLPWRASRSKCVKCGDGTRNKHWHPVPTSHYLHCHGI